MYLFIHVYIFIASSYSYYTATDIHHPDVSDLVLCFRYKSLLAAPIPTTCFNPYTHIANELKRCQFKSTLRSILLSAVF